MADQTTSSIVVAATPARIMAVIADFESYPSWAESVREAQVLSRDGDGPNALAKQVRFVIDAGPIRDDYVLEYNWGDDEVRWQLVQSEFLKAMDGAYVLRPVGHDETEVSYRLAVDVKIPMIGLLKRKAERVIIDTALKGLKRQAESGE